MLYDVLISEVQLGIEMTWFLVPFSLFMYVWISSVQFSLCRDWGNWKLRLRSYCYLKEIAIQEKVRFGCTLFTTSSISTSSVSCVAGMSEEESPAILATRGANGCALVILSGLTMVSYRVANTIGSEPMPALYLFRLAHSDPCVYRALLPIHGGVWSNEMGCKLIQKPCCLLHLLLTMLPPSHLEKYVVEPGRQRAVSDCVKGHNCPSSVRTR